MDVGLLTRNAVHVLPEGELERKLASGRPLRVKLGIDVTSPDIHVGRAIPALIAEGGFRIEDMQTMYLPGTPRFAGFNYWGSAAKR